LYPKWKQAIDEMDALLSRQTWELVSLSLELLFISCCWVFTIKYIPDDTMDRYKD